VLQTFLCLFTIAVADDSTLIKAQLMTTRVTRIVLAVVGCVQGVRRQVSYFHLVALSTLHHLMALPDYFVVFQSFSLVSHSLYLAFERSLNLTAFILSATLNLSLAFVSTQLWDSDELCVGQSSPKVLSVRSYVTWGDGFMNAMILFQYVLLDGLLVLYPALPSSSLPPRQFSFYHFSFIRTVVLAIFTTISVYSTIGWLNDVADKSQQQWSFGQMFALASVGVTSASQWLEYLVDDGGGLPRYRQWIQGPFRVRSAIIDVVSKRIMAIVRSVSIGAKLTASKIAWYMGREWRFLLGWKTGKCVDRIGRAKSPVNRTGERKVSRACCVLQGRGC